MLLGLLLFLAAPEARARESSGAEDESGILGLSGEVVLPAPTEVRNVPQPPGVRVAAERWTVATEVLAAVRSVAGDPVGVRMEAASRSFLDLPYRNEAAGEGEGIDPDPPARYDTFDCLTFVEEVLGLSLAGDPLHAPLVRTALRYRGEPSYARRRHFMEAQWLPEAVRNGFLTDITAHLAPARTLAREITPDTWRRWRHRRVFQLPDAALPLGSWNMVYLDLAQAAEAAPRIPPGSVVVTLRQPRDWSPVVTTHIGIVVSTAKGPRMRHATRMGVQKVRDDRVDWYIHHLRDYVNWPALGIAVYLPREQGPRNSALTISPVPATPFPPAEGVAPVFEPRPIEPLPR